MLNYGTGANPENVLDMTLHRSNHAAQSGMRKLRELREAEERYRVAKEKRALVAPEKRPGSPESRECLKSAEAVRDASKAVTKALEEWERTQIADGADFGG